PTYNSNIIVTHIGKNENQDINSEMIEDRLYNDDITSQEDDLAINQNEIINEDTLYNNSNTSNSNDKEEKCDKTNYDLNNLSMRFYISHLQDIEAKENKEGSRNKTTNEQDTNGHNILLELHLINFPASFTVDIMHAFFENIASYIFCHFIEKYFKNKILMILIIKAHPVTEKITQIIEQNQTIMLMGFGRPSINIQKHYFAFKTEDWYYWIVLYLLLFFHN
ncbi:14727_t:CDS:2, partial [Funneliformis mosseae]